MCFHAKQTKSAQEVHQRFSTRGQLILVVTTDFLILK